MEKLKELWIDYKNQILLGAVAVVALGFWFFNKQPSQSAMGDTNSFSAVSATDSGTQGTSTSRHGKICVDVKGSVAHPGIYYFKQGSRVQEALSAAGGALPNAEMKAVNLAKELADQQVVYIPAVGEQVNTDLTSQNATGNSQGSDTAGKSTVNINNATKEQLTQVTGIGDKKADLIIAYRQEHGQFKSVDDLTQITGFGDKTVAKIKDQLSV
ncbi:MAG: helix-hairpin-helix domain-containing protein [Limosilactobacillus sp.]|uniref:helix-hairpin-helix domain-containing protein n=1 Tax=Limosilactobacillus sp. TaxID=2773925 RepID=UPI0026F7216B|nr:helix-hairpin-helix domain-containing protein [Limosilactobacillus sp.]